MTAKTSKSGFALLDVGLVAVLKALPGVKAAGSTAGDVTNDVLLANPEQFTVDGIWESLKEGVAKGLVLRDEVCIERKTHMVYNLTTVGESIRPGKGPLNEEVREKFIHKKGEVPCPSCGSKDTGSATVPGSFPVGRFACFDCGKKFNHSASTQTKEKTMAKASKNLDDMTTKELTELHNSLVAEGDRVKGFKDRPTAIARVKKAQSAKGTKKAVAKGPRKSREGTAFAKIRELFSRRKQATMDELMALTDKDAHWISSVMWVLKNKDRTDKDRLLLTDYDRKTRTYSLVSA